MSGCGPSRRHTSGRRASPGRWTRSRRATHSTKSYSAVIRPPGTRSSSGDWKIAASGRWPICTPAIPRRSRGDTRPAAASCGNPSCFAGRRRPTTSWPWHPAWTLRAPTWSGWRWPGRGSRRRWETPTSSSWYWHYSNAVGGVPVYVRYREAQRACEVLAAARAKLAESLSPWTCPSCGQRVAGQWAVCWQCGRAADGTPSEQPAEEVAAPPGGEAERCRRPVGHQGSRCGGGDRDDRVGGHFGLEMIVIFVPLPSSSSSSCSSFAIPGRPLEPGEPPLPEPSATRSQLSRAIVRRAWQAAVIGLCVFPPLNFYSTWLLLKLGERDTPLGRADRRRCGMALFINVAVIALCVVVCGLMPLQYAYFQMGFDFRRARGHGTSARHGTLAAQISLPTAKACPSEGPTP